MISTSSSLTTAGLAVGLALLGEAHWRWYRGSGGAVTPAAGKGKGKGGPPAAATKARDPKALIPLWFGVAFGTVMVGCPAGLLGAASGFLRWGGNGLGDFVMSKMTGQHAENVAEASAPALDANGALVVTAVVIALWLLRKSFAKAIKGQFWRGVWGGTLLAIGTGMFAYIGNAVVPGVNSLGAELIGQVVHGSLV